MFTLLSLLPLTNRAHPVDIPFIPYALDTVFNWDLDDAPNQAEELVRWLTWIDSWATGTASRGQEMEGYEKR